MSHHVLYASGSWGGFAVAMLIWGGLAAAADEFRKWQRRRGVPERAPRPGRLSPFTASLIRGQHVPGYESRFRAVSPGGITVTGWCCSDGRVLRGHQSPEQAAEHARQRAERVSSGR